jgi:hypothetical protein
MKRFAAPLLLRTARAFGPALLVALAIVQPGAAAPPVVPLPPPLFSFDLDSPTVIEGLVGAADLLAPSEPHPNIIVPGYWLGLQSLYDDLDALSKDHSSEIPPGALFAILFSVDRETIGTTPPEQFLVTMGRPFNVLDQAERGHAAGDQYMSLTLFSRGSGAQRGARAVNNTQVRNNYDEGGTDFGAVPCVDSYGNPVSGLVAGPTPTLQDNVDAACRFPSSPTWLPMNVYFSVTSASPSLVNLPGSNYPSGAHIFFNPDPLEYAPTFLYAPFYELGLQQADDIDSLLVFDANADGFFNPPDMVIFSLTHDSPSLYVIPGASSQGAAADLFIARPGQPVMLFAPAAVLGLGYAQDNLDALDVVPCADAYACALDYAIQVLKGDLNCDGSVNFGDINPFVLALSNPGLYETTYYQCFIENGDINRDGVTGFGDINPFVAILSGGDR